MSKNVVTSKSGSEVIQCHWKWYHSIDCLWFLISAVTLCVRHSAYNYIVTLKPWLRVTRGHRNRHVSIRHMISYWWSIETKGPSRTVSEINADFSRKSQNVNTPCILCPCWRGSIPLELSVGARGQNRMMGLPRRERILTIYWAVWMQCTNVTDTRTPGDSNECAYAYRRAVKH